MASLVLLFVLVLTALGQKSERVITHKIRSEHLGKVETSIHVLLPSNLEEGRRYQVLYILPVVDGDANWGQPFKVAMEENFADRYGVICVMATYPRGTLYCNHPEKRNQQDESYFVKDVVPFIDRTYPTIKEARGRLLTGFCASGSGSMWLMLRHLDLFGKVAVWDAWLDLDHMIAADAKLFGTDENYREYAVLNQIDLHAHELLDGPTRIVMMAYRNQRDGPHAVHRFHDKLYDYGIPHLFEFHEKEAHRWDSGWLPRAVEYLFLEKLPEGVGKGGTKPKTAAQMDALHRGALNRRRRIILHHDAAFSQFKPSMKLDDAVEAVYAFAGQAGSQVDTVMLDIDGGAVYWPSEHMSQVAGLKKWFADGNDLLRPMVKGGHERGFEVFFSYRVNGIANPSPEPLKRERADWLIDWRENPTPPHDPRIPWDHSDWQTGKKGKWGGDAGLWNYALPEVRALQLAAIREVVSRYDIDGFQLDFVRHGPYLPVGKQWQHRDKLTEFIKSVRTMIREVELKRGKPLLFGVKVASSVAGCHFDGIDIERWIGDGLVDLVAMGARSLEVEVREFRELVGGAPVKLYPSHDRHHGSDGYSYPPLRYHRAVMANFWHQRPDGVMLFNFGGGRVDGGKRHDDSEGFRQFGGVDSLKLLDKTFVIQRRAGGHPWEFGHPEDGNFQPWAYSNSNLDAPLPAGLGQHGKGLTYLSIEVADDLSDAEVGGRFKQAKLRVLYSDPEAKGKTIPGGATKYRYGGRQFKVNPIEVRHALTMELRLNNIHLGEPVVASDGWLEWTVEKEVLARGKNLIAVRLSEPRNSILIECVELELDYQH